jgi:hypothetical protein
VRSATQIRYPDRGYAALRLLCGGETTNSLTQQNGQSRLHLGRQRNSSSAPPYLDPNDWLSKWAEFLVVAETVLR